MNKLYERIIHLLTERKKGNKPKKGRCWTGYKPTPGVKPYAPGSCEKK